METFDRIGPSPFLPDGTTQNTSICFAGGSKLRIYGGKPYTNFRLMFSNSVGEGWWVGPEVIDHLIAELLYIRRDIQKFKDRQEVTFDIEVGAASAEAWEDPEEEEEGREEAPY